MQAGEPEVPAFVNENTAAPAGGQRVSPFAAAPQEAPVQERPAVQEERAPRSFMDGIPAYMRRK